MTIFLFLIVDCKPSANCFCRGASFIVRQKASVCLSVLFRICRYFELKWIVNRYFISIFVLDKLLCKDEEYFQDLKRKDHKRYLGGLDLFKYIGPGLLVTVGFVDPGNWASNFAAGSEFGYSLLWVVTLSTIMLIVLQHNVAHLGIVTGLCLSEAATKYTPKWVSRPILGTAVLASISTSLAEILGGAIALEMLLDIPIIWGAVLTTLFVSIMLFTNSYKKIERSIIAFVSVIGLSFIYELFLVDIDWPAATVGWVTPAFPKGSMLIIMSVLGAVVMPHNLFLHSEVIQSHEYNKKDDASIKKVLKYELFDTLFQ